MMSLQWVFTLNFILKNAPESVAPKQSPVYLLYKCELIKYTCQYYLHISFAYFQVAYNAPHKRTDSNKQF